MIHLFRKVIPSVAMSSAQTLGLIAQCPLWKYAWQLNYLRTLHEITQFPFDYPTFPILVVTPPDLEFPVFHDQLWSHILAYSDQSLATHVWQSLPPLQQSFPLAQATVEQRRQLLALCAQPLSPAFCRAFATEEFLTWQESLQLLRELFAVWKDQAPSTMNPLYTKFPVILSCVLSRNLPYSTLPLSSPANCLITGSQLIFYWHKNAMALARLVDIDTRKTLLFDLLAYVHPGYHGVYPYEGNILLSLIHLTHVEYLGFFQPSFRTAFRSLCSTLSCEDLLVLPSECRTYLSDVFYGNTQEAYLDPVFHFWLLENTSLADKYPDIFTHHLPPVNWLFYFPPSKPSFALHAFNPPYASPSLLSTWQTWNSFSTYEALIPSLGFNHCTTLQSLDYASQMDTSSF
jgi:hypothetical protein